MRPRAELQAWYASGWRLAPRLGPEAQDRIELAIRLNPVDPDYRLALGRFYHWQAQRQVFDAPLIGRLLDKAAASTRRALDLRPTWGEAWAALARLRADRGVADEVAIDALRNALKFSPWERRTLEDSVIAGMLLWPRLPGSVRRQYRQAVDRMFGFDRGRFVVDAALRYGWVPEVREHIPPGHGLHRYLESQLRVFGNAQG